MYLNLSDFDKYVNVSILKRGQSYLRQGHIMALEEEEGNPGSWLALVEGSYGDYDVNVLINDRDQITMSSCNCPYDWGDYCKHVVAVLLKIRSLHSKKTDKKKDTSKNVQKPSVEEMLEQYKQLPLIEQQILKILALYWEPSTAENIATHFRECGFNKQSGKQSFTFIHAPLQLLFSQKLLERKGYNQFQLPHDYADALCNEYFATDEDFKKIARYIQRTLSYYSSWYNANSQERQFRNLRLGKFLDDLRLFEESFNNLSASRKKEYSYPKLIEYSVGVGFQRKKWDSLGRGVRFFMLYKHFELAIAKLTDVPAPLLEYAEESIGDLNPGGRITLAEIMAQWQLLRGDWGKIKDISKFFLDHITYSFSGISCMQDGDREEAEKTFRTARKHLRQIGIKKELDHINGIFFTLSQIQPNDLPANQKIKKQLDHLTKEGGLYATSFYYLNALLEFFENKKTYAEQILSQEPQLPLHRFFLYLCRYWVEPNLINPTTVEAYRKRLDSEGYLWMSAEMSALLKAIGYPTDVSLLPKGKPMIELLPRIEAWETALSKLLNISGKAESRSQGENRIVWLIDFDNHLIQARHQTLGKNGWTKGRPINFLRFHREKIPGTTAQDERFVKAKGYGEGSEIYLSSMDPSWKELVGHPLLFLKKSPKTGLQIVEVQPKLLAKKTESGFQLSFVPEVSAEGSMIIKETPTRYLFVEISPQIAQIAEALNHHTLSIPQKGEEQLQKVLSGLAELIDIQSSFEDDQLPTVEADNRICIHLLPVGDGFHVEPYVKPFRSEPPYVKPAQGEAHLIGTVDGQRLSTTRDLKSEEENLKLLRKKVPVLQKRLSDNTWKLEDTESCLQLLLQLKPLIEDKSIIVEWPQGEKLSLDSVVGMDQFRLSIRDGNNWFELEGELKVNEEKVLSLQELLLLSEQETSFVEISPGRFLALTEEFRRRLQSINGLPSRDKKSGKLILHPLAAHGMEDFAEAVEQLDISPAFLENKQRLEKAFAQKFRVPTSFKATLRPYQKEGYQWLCRCATWGVGACLADDMGLGKTIQALAFLCKHSTLGPALVVAPASVCRNWVAETKRFSPQLKPVLFGEGDRKEEIESAGKGSIVIVTYDLMVRESDLFLGKKWATVILDEAQAIKNQATRRSKTAMKLDADFRMVMTGTPIENHLGELWNLFQFINPGLLGDLDSFNQRFTLPIEKYKSEHRREQLHKLVRPFILRRKKDEVLKDLPEKTEVTLSVELSEDERSFYEALRRNAVDNLMKTENDQPGQQHIRILAEIMKLRRAACHPTLADKKTHLNKSSKLELFGEIVHELLDNGHKALVFSQFVDHLKILEKHLKKHKISYQYLDGRTPGKKRQAAIDAFQAGEGDIFLISLKAGGTGLNLTAADYVIHTDPWWNPAVEDQATDRAHRIGQQKPVTVYRLIAQQTIEEKILKLHAQKRDLADSLLAGTDSSAKLTAKDLMELIND